MDETGAYYRVKEVRKKNTNTVLLVLLIIIMGVIIIINTYKWNFERW